jgi:hypothetical protein
MLRLNWVLGRGDRGAELPRVVARGSKRAVGQWKRFPPAATGTVRGGKCSSGRVSATEVAAVCAWWRQEISKRRKHRAHEGGCQERTAKQR